MFNKADIGTTLAGGGAGMALLVTVRWEAIPFGECVKLIAAFALILIGCRMYRTPPTAS